MRLMIACRAIDNMAGGVERQAIALANDMRRRGHDVSLITLDPEGAKAFYDIDPKVTWYQLGMGDPTVRASWSLRLKRMKKVRQIIKEFKPDNILAFQDGMFTTLYLYLIGLNVPIIAAERETPYRYDFVKYRTPKWFIFLIFQFAKAITVQCPSYVEAYPKRLQKKIRVIPNSVYPAEKLANPKGVEGQEKIILCVGRLTYQKNQTVMLKAFSRLTKSYPDWRVQLVGAGDAEGKIQAQVKELQLTDKVDFIGAVSNIADYYAGAHFLCIPSYWEGFPNVLAEALAHGLPAVGYEGCGGVVDLINHSENGLLAEGNGKLESLQVAIEQMMKFPEKRENMGKKAIESVKPYVPELVYDMWEDFLQKAK